MTNVDYVDGFTWHGRLGDLKNAFKYKVGFVLLDLDESVRGPAFFSRTSGYFFGIIDSDYGWWGYSAQTAAIDPIVRFFGQEILELPTGQALLIKS